MAFGDALNARIKEFKNTSTRSTAGGKTPFHIKLKEIAIDDLQRNYPSSISSAELIDIYRRIMDSNLKLMPADKQKLLANGQHSYWVTVRNAFSSNRGPGHPQCLANAKEVLATQTPNGRGNGVIYQANPTFLGSNPSAGTFSTISSHEDGTTIMTSNAGLAEEVDDTIEQEKIRKATVLSPAQVAEADKRTPDYSKNGGTSHRANTDASLAKTVLANAGYSCELSSLGVHSHNTFTTTHGVQYLEAHHLVPMKFQKDYSFNIDRSINIVALCPTCHKAIHYGDKATKKVYLEPLYSAKKAALSAIGIDMCATIDDFINKYY